MSYRRLGRFLKLGALGIAAVGTGLLLKHNDWEIATIGAYRFGRAALAAVITAVDYKISLRNVDSESEEYHEVISKVHLRSAERLRDMCRRNGGAFIKVGQHIGALDYLLPVEYVCTMKVFHNQAPQSKLADLLRVVEEDLGQKVEELFSQFEEEPLGTASLAQVHKAKLKDGTEVAVKIQHPLVKAHSFVDIKTMELLINGIAWLFPGFKYQWLSEETKKNLPIELDFLNEGRNCERVSRMFRKFDFLKVPKVYWNLSSERVLTMEFCEGGKVDNVDYMKENNISVNEVTKNLGKLYSEMIFVQGYIHCDPHPGNVLVNRTKKGTQIVLLDHGLYQSLTDEFRVNYCKLWMAIINADVKGIKKYAQAMNAGDMHGLFACMLTARSWKAVSSGIDKYEYSPDEGEEIKANAARYMIEITDILDSVPRQLLLILKTNDVLRSIETRLRTRSDASSFINMSKCCVQAVGHDAKQKCDNWVCRMRVTLATFWLMLKIDVYEFCLWLRDINVGQKSSPL